MCFFDRGVPLLRRFAFGADDDVPLEPRRERVAVPRDFGQSDAFAIRPRKLLFDGEQAEPEHRPQSSVDLIGNRRARRACSRIVQPSVNWPSQSSRILPERPLNAVRLRAVHDPAALDLHVVGAAEQRRGEGAVVAGDAALEGGLRLARALAGSYDTVIERDPQHLPHVE